MEGDRQQPLPSNTSLSHNFHFDRLSTSRGITSLNNRLIIHADRHKVLLLCYSAVVERDVIYQVHRLPFPK